MRISTSMLLYSQSRDPTSLAFCNYKKMNAHLQLVTIEYNNRSILNLSSLEEIYHRLS